MEVNSKILKSEFFRNVSFQMVGTALAQAIPFAATPILTRMYGKEDFATYTAFFAVASILVVLAGGRYQLAVVLPRRNTDGNKVFTLSIYVTLVLTLLLIVSVFAFSELILPSLGASAYLLPLYVLFYGLWNSFSYLSVRRKTFFHNAAAKVLQAAFYVVMAICMGFTTFAYYGLIVAKISGMAISWGYLQKKLSIRTEFASLRTMKDVAIRYADYPRFGIIPALLDVASLQALILFLTKYYSTSDLGNYGLTSLALTAPLALIGGAFKDVFYQRIASLVNRKDFAGARLVFKRSALGLFAIGLPICLVIYFFGPPLFKLVFGDEWQRSGEFASILAASFLVQLIVSPLSSVFNAAHKVKIASAWQTLYFTSTFTTLGITAVVLKLPIESLLFVYAIHEVVLYLVYFLLQFWTLKKLE